jgi:hypothetical protein
MTESPLALHRADYLTGVTSCPGSTDLAGRLTLIDCNSACANAIENQRASLEFLIHAAMRPSMNVSGAPTRA